MKENELLKLEQERALGEYKQHVYDEHVKPYVEAKKEELFLAFQSVAAQDVEQLQAIKMQCTALHGIAAEFEQYITTGRMASIKLNEEENNGTN